MVPATRLLVPPSAPALVIRSSPPPGVNDLADLFTAIRQQPYAMLLLSGGDSDPPEDSSLLSRAAGGRPVKLVFTREER